MEEQNPYLTEISSELAQLWLAENRLQLDAEVAQLSQANMLQFTMVNRIAAAKKLIRINLINEEIVLGQVVQIGLDAILIRTSMTKQLLPLHSIAYIAGLPKAGNPSKVKRSLLIPTLLSMLNRRLVVDFKSGDRIIGELVNIWQDCIDLALSGQQLTIKLTELLKVEIGN
jgi:exosome complex RNA-binding protein Csl4